MFVITENIMERPVYNTTFNTKEDLLLATHCIYVPCHSYNKEQLPSHSPLTEWPSNGSKLCSLCDTNWTSTLYNNIKGVGLLGDVVRTCNAGVSYFLNIIRLNVISFTLVRELRHSLPYLQQNHKYLITLHSDPLYGISSKSKSNRHGRIFIDARN